MSNSNTVPEVQSLQDLIKEYFDNIPTIIDQFKLDTIIERNLLQYELPFKIQLSEPITSNKQVLKAANFVVHENYSAYHFEQCRNHQQLVSRAVELSAEGFESVSYDDFNLAPRFKSLILVMRKPRETVEKERSQIKQELEEIFKSEHKANIQELMSKELALEYAQRKQSEQQKSLEDYIVQQSIDEAHAELKEAMKISDYSALIESLEDQDYVFFNDIKEKMNTPDNDIVSELLTHCDFVKVRRTLSDGKQTSLFVKDFIANDPTFDYKSIQV